MSRLPVIEGFDFFLGILQIIYRNIDDQVGVMRVCGFVRSSGFERNSFVDFSGFLKYLIGSK